MNEADGSRLVPAVIRVDPAARPGRPAETSLREVPTLLNQPAPLTVSQVTGKIKLLLESAPTLQNVRVQGEITDYRGPAPSGHHYFTLKDEDAAISCVLWAGNSKRVSEQPRNGAAMVITGDLGVYAKRGTYQLSCTDLVSTGQGALYLQFMELKAKLQGEGLFDESRKRELPTFPRVIGIVTSLDGAALRDILKILKRRAPHVQVRIAGSLVQGELAASQLLKALYALDNDPEIDCLILARGGGSLEDLACFNNEDLVRGCARLTTPLVTGVGHEYDFTLVDFIADQRAPTPTGAAALVCPDRSELLSAVGLQAQLVTQRLTRRLRRDQDRLDQVLGLTSLARPTRRFAQRGQEVDDLLERARRALQRRITQRQADVARWTSLLRETHPARLLERGYALVTDSSGHVVRGIAGRTVGEALTVQVSDGAIPVTVSGVPNAESLIPRGTS